MPTLGTILFLILLLLVSFAGYKLSEIEEQIEDHLAYRPPIASARNTSADKPDCDTSDARTIYVPVYSHIYALGGTPMLLESTLSIRNTDPENDVVITSVNYYGTKGNLIEKYIDGNLVLGPLSSSEILVEKQDTRGGIGANFLVAWNSDKPVHPPIVQAVMVGGEGGQQISFRTDGQPLASRIDP